MMRSNVSGGSDSRGPEKVFMMVVAYLIVLAEGSSGPIKLIC